MFDAARCLILWTTRASWLTEDRGKTSTWPHWWISKYRSYHEVVRGRFLGDFHPQSCPRRLKILHLQCQYILKVLNNKCYQKVVVLFSGGWVGGGGERREGGGRKNTFLARQIPTHLPICSRSKCRNLQFEFGIEFRDSWIENWSRKNVGRKQKMRQNGTTLKINETIAD